MIGFDFDPEGLEEKENRLKKRITGVSIWRLLLFFCTGGGLVLFFSGSAWWGLLPLLTGVAFIQAVGRYNFLKDQQAIFKSLQAIQHETVLRKQRSLDSFESGEEFLEKEHPYCNDLDVFGKHSLFQLLNHTSSTTGKHLLAARLKAQMDLKQGESLHAAIGELSENPAFLQAFETLGRTFYREEKTSQGWDKWLREPLSTSRMLQILDWLGLMGGLLVIGLIFFSILPAPLLGLWILLGIPFLGRVFKPLKEAADRIPASAMLKTYYQWVLLLESVEFQNSFLKQRRKELLFPGGVDTSRLLKDLQNLSFWIQNRLNLLYLPFNLIFWGDLVIFGQWARWKTKWGGAIGQLPDDLAEWEVLVSLAIFEQQEKRNAAIRMTDSYSFQAEGLSHPLLVPEKAIPNDFAVYPPGKLILLTGSNMSGKTTFMRTIGINLVLLNLGLSPFAKGMTVGNFQLFTSMRNTDNLGENVSSFYAELRRIKRLLVKLETGQPLFFFLDEILKGTNTEDRIAGSEALIRQLAPGVFLGLISTHDIELSRLEERIPYVKNYSFHSKIQEDRIDFDYLIKPGPCPSFNAQKLMELMGIRLEKKA